MADQGTEGLLSSFLRNQRFKAVLPFINGSVLDVGCGTGELAKFLSPDNYTGVEVDDLSINEAKSNYPKHKFVKKLSDIDGIQFDTIVSLAVIEHVSDPAIFLRTINSYLRKSSDSKIVITTPHPSMEWIHNWGSKIGLFSKHANEEHDVLLDENVLKKIAIESDLHLSIYNRFLLGANQLAVFKKEYR